MSQSINPHHPWKLTPEQSRSVNYLSHISKISWRIEYLKKHHDSAANWLHGRIRQRYWWKAEADDPWEKRYRRRVKEYERWDQRHHKAVRQLRGAKQQRARTLLKPQIVTFHTSRPRRTTDKSPAAASETAPKYKYIEDCELLERYCPGGFYPLKLGDRLCDGCYSIVQNLGFGGSFTVWLASDQKQQDPNGAHNCLVMGTTAGCSLTQSKSLAFHGLLDLRLARAIAADLVFAVQFLHGQSIIHGGE
ncbi:hypothetical protein ACO22_07767 [Paracoccidioides brasiliensis]|uniref:Protein kinase domain-containing protein n=1 Tax=Paracoccidioides brasiliensis TaxID=121759 RepID=A0A1D2J3P9_PARBR|nr:hypothetical protein ACO22_07767 [Paracoccidioides brasiliensis]